MTTGWSVTGAWRTGLEQAKRTFDWCIGCKFHASTVFPTIESQLFVANVVRVGLFVTVVFDCNHGASKVKKSLEIE